MNNSIIEQKKLTYLRETLKINGLNRHYLYRVKAIPSVLLKSLNRGKQQKILDLLTEYAISKDLYNQVYLSNISLSFLVEYTRKLAIRTKKESLLRYYVYLSEIEYRKPRTINKIHVAEIRSKLEFPCHFVDCTNEREIRDPEHKLNNTFCMKCIKTKFDEQLKPSILKEWKDVVDKETIKLANELKRGCLVASFHNTKTIYSIRKPAYRRYGWFGSYCRTDNEVKLYLRQFNTETEILSTYVHEIGHHFNPEKAHGKQFYEFIIILLERLNFKPYKYRTYQNGDINYRYIMEIKIPKRSKK